MQFGIPDPGPTSIAINCGQLDDGVCRLNDLWIRAFLEVHMPGTVKHGSMHELSPVLGRMIWLGTCARSMFRPSDIYIFNNEPGFPRSEAKLAGTQPFHHGRVTMIEE